MDAPRDRTPWLLAVPLLLAAAAYARVLHGEFVFDDLPAIVDHRALRDPWALLAAAGPSWLGGGRPVTDLTFSWNLALGGPVPFGFHLVNVALHLAVAVAAWALARAALRLAGAARPDLQAVVVAGLFAVHPLQSQAVSYVVQRAEALASGLMLLSLLALLRADRGGPRALAWYAGAAAAFALALGAKPMAVTVPALAALLLLALPPAGAAAPPGRGRRRLAALAGLGLLALANGAVVVRSLDRVTRAGFDLARYDPWTYLLTQTRVLVTYLRLLAWPAGQSLDWAIAPSRSLGDPGVLPCLAALLALGGAAVAACVAGRRGGAGPGRGPGAERRAQDLAALRIAGAGVLWWFVALAPTSSLVPLADPLFEHRTYLANLGLLLAVVALLERALARLRWRHAPRAAAALVLAAWAGLAAALHQRNAAWETEVGIWEDATRDGRGDWRAWLGLARAHERRGDAAAALRAYRTLYQRSKGRPALEAAALRQAGLLLLEGGDAAQAAGALRASEARHPGQPGTALGLARALRRLGQEEEADRWLAAAVQAAPDDPGVLQEAGLRHAGRGDVEEAHRLLARAARAAPWDATAQANHGVAAQRLGLREEACRAWSAALAAAPPAELARGVEERRREAGCPPP